MSVIDVILTWSRTLPMWQQDALRRLYEKPALSDEDIAELVELCKRHHGVAPGASDIAPSPLHEPSSDAAEPRVPLRLVSIDERENINALAKEPPLSFAAKGITIIYGDNGSGKTGYGRLIRLACRARRKPAGILGNVYTPGSEQSAVIRYQFGDGIPASFTWSPTARPPDTLRRVSVFDGECALFYITERQDIPYLPAGLDLFERLAGACRVIRGKLQRELAALPIEAAWDQSLDGTAVRAQLDALPDTTALSALETMAVLTDEELKTLGELEADLAKLGGQTPELRHAALARSHTNLKQLAERLAGIATGLSGTAVENGVRLAREAIAAKTASDAAARNRFSGLPLKGVGEEAWSVLWEAAREYSTQTAYPGESFPVTAGGLCVLCQQPLEPPSPERFKSFEEFVQDATAKDAASKRKLLNDESQRARELSVTTASDADVLAIVKEYEPALESDLRTFLSEAAVVQKEFLKHLADPELAAMPSLPPSPEDRVATMIAELKAEVDRVAKLVGDDAVLEADKTRRNLAARRWLSDHLQDVKDCAAARILRAQLTKATSTGTNTASITKKGTDVAKDVVTPALVNRFKKELLAVRAEHLSIALQHLEGELGTTYVQLTLVGAGVGAPRDVLSEGEKNLVSMAAFFAELDPESGDAIVFDDPVSSLDHNHRFEVAARLAQEAKQRQVIVFTHDLVFFGYLVDRARGNAVAVSEVTVTNFGSAAGSGIPEQDVPWDVRNVDQRVKKLEHMIRLATKAAKENRLDDARAIAGDFYEKLRETWERAVEVELLGGVVERWRKSVDVGQLKKISSGLAAGDIQTVEREIAHVSLFCHSQTPESSRKTPQVAAMEGELTRLEAWRASVKAAQS